MKSMYLKLLGVLAVAILVLACESKEQKHDENHEMHHHHVMHDTSHQHSAKSEYYCPMDTQIVQDKPGICPICKMDLVLKERAGAANEEWIYKPSNSIVLSNVKTTKPLYKPMSLTVDVSGYISYDTRRIYSISSKIEGRIEELNIKYAYQQVKKGEPLLEVYSHELLTAQNEYRYVTTNDADEAIVKAAKNKLLLLGMTESQIKNILNTKHVYPTTTVFSPYSGYIIEKEQGNSSQENTSGSMRGSGAMGSSGVETNSSQSALLREGSYVKKGEPLFKVANTEVVWGIFETFSSNLKTLKVGQPIHITVNNTDKMLTGKIDFIEPDFKDKSGTVRFRVYLNNQKGHLKIGNLLTGKIKAEIQKGLWVPQTAIYDLGKEKVVFIKRNGAFEVKQVITGASSENEMMIVDGLKESDEIAENAQFMIDSESFVKTQK